MSNETESKLQDQELLAVAIRSILYVSDPEEYDSDAIEIRRKKKK